MVIFSPSPCGALAVHEEGAAVRGHRGVRARVGHLHAEVAAPPVEVERPGLENSLLLARVEVAEGDEVVEQRVEIAVVAHQPLDGGDGVASGSSALSLAMSAVIASRLRAFEQRAHPRAGRGLDLGAGLARAPRVEGRELRAESAPTALRSGLRRRRAAGWITAARSAGDRRAPRRVQPVVERERLVGGDAGEREGNDLGDRRRRAPSRRGPRIRPARG
jgi:hypothetical protein